MSFYMQKAAKNIQFCNKKYVKISVCKRLNDL